MNGVGNYGTESIVELINKNVIFYLIQAKTFLIVSYDSKVSHAQVADENS